MSSVAGFAWLPPEELRERALGNEHGGGAPSLAYRLSGPWRPFGGGYEHEALLLELDGKPCPLSIARGRALLDSGERLFGENSPRDLGTILVARLGGELVEVYW